jgi:hypothetical protein
MDIYLPKEYYMKTFVKNLNTFKILMILNTVAFSAPTMWLLLKIYDGDKENIIKFIILSVVGIILIISGWAVYFKHYRNDN